MEQAPEKVKGYTVDGVRPHRYDFSGKAIAYKIDAGALHAILIDVAADGESLRLAAKDTQTDGDTTQDSFGTATTVKAAFDRFWGPRDDVGQRAASLVYRKATAVSDAAAELIEADGAMSDAASTALGRVPADYSPPPIWQDPPGTSPFNFGS